MAEQVKKGAIERGSNTLKKIHYGLGGAALIGAELIPPISTALLTFAVWEGVHGAFWHWVENRRKK